MKHASWILDHIKNAGYKLTPPRKRVIEWIEKKDNIFSANEVIASLPEMDRVSIYRTLELLEQLDCIHKVLVHHGEQHYEMHGDSHHHHIVCSGCEDTKCIPCDVKRKKIAGFSNIHHSVVFTGVCGACD